MPISSPAGVKEASRPIENEGREDLLLNQDVHLMLEDFIFWLSLAIRAGVDASRVCSRNTGGCSSKRDSPASKGLNRNDIFCEERRQKQCCELLRYLRQIFNDTSLLLTLTLASGLPD